MCIRDRSLAAQGGYMSQGRTLDTAVKLVTDAIALEQAGCFAIVLECVPPVSYTHLRFRRVPAADVQVQKERLLSQHVVIGQRGPQQRLAPIQPVSYTHLGTAIPAPW